MTNAEQNTPYAAAEKEPEKHKQRRVLWILVAVLVAVLAAAQLSGARVSESGEPQTTLARAVLPPDGVALPVRWGRLGRQLLEAGVIDEEKFLRIYADRAVPYNDMTELLYGDDDAQIVISAQNSGFLLNLFWAFGLANKNQILEKGPMTDARYGGASRFASTGGWTLAEGDAMEHYSAHHFVTLTEAQQALVERVSKNIYRPCCGNSTYFPDCNHGMAMLGLLELMASQDIPEEKMYEIALQVNAYWFPDTYLTIAEYFKNRGVDWRKINPKEILGSAYSSAEGYQQILAEVDAFNPRSGGSCGV